MCRIWATAHGCRWAGRCGRPQPTTHTHPCSSRAHTHPHSLSSSYISALTDTHFLSVPSLSVAHTRSFLLCFTYTTSCRGTGPSDKHHGASPCWSNSVGGGAVKRRPLPTSTLLSRLSPHLQGHADAPGNQEGLPTGTLQLDFFVPAKQRGASTLQVEAGKERGAVVVKLTLSRARGGGSTPGPALGNLRPVSPSLPEAGSAVGVGGPDTILAAWTETLAHQD